MIVKKIRIEIVDSQMVIRALMTIVAAIQRKATQLKSKSRTHLEVAEDPADKAYRQFFHALTCAFWTPPTDTNVEDLGIDMERVSRAVALTPEYAKAWSDLLEPELEITFVPTSTGVLEAAAAQFERWTGRKVKFTDPQSQILNG